MPPHQIGGVKESCAVYLFLRLSVLRLCVVSKSVRFRAITLIGNLVLKSEVEPIGQYSLRVTTSRRSDRNILDDETFIRRQYLENQARYSHGYWTWMRLSIICRSRLQYRLITRRDSNGHRWRAYCSTSSGRFRLLILVTAFKRKKTSGQSNLTTGRIAAAQRRFNGIRQVAPVCTSPNPWAHPIPNIPNGISIDSADFARLMAESPYFTIGHPFSP